MGESMGNYAAKKRYEDRVYCELKGQLDKNLVFKFKTLCDRAEESYNSVIRNGIRRFMEETETLERSE